MSDPRSTAAALLADQRQRWQQGERVLVEAYLAGHPQLRADPDGVLDLIYNEIFLREQRGETARLEEYVHRFPQWRNELALQFEVHQAIQSDRPLPAAPPGPVDIPGYDLLAEIGRGGMGVVYKARDRAHDRLVAVKMLLPEHFQRRPALKRFLAESRAVVALSHWNIVKVFQVGESAAGPFYVMELIDGPSLEEIIRRGTVPVPWAVQTLLAVAEAVEYAHGQGVIHRDLKPSNILVDAGRGPVVVDFGMAKVRKVTTDTGQSTGTRSGTILGTPAFMPPEQTGTDLSATGPYSDVYALGAVLYALLTGRPPYDEGNTLDTIMKVRSPDPPPPIHRLRADVPAELAQMCMKCLEKPPERRYPTALALAEALRALQAPGPAVAAAGPEAAPCLVDLASGKRFALARGATLLGRAAECDLVVKAPEVSRRHCRIVLTGEGAELEDLGSLRGTKVNGKRATRCGLRDGDRLDIAGHAFRFHEPASERA
jgi:eukaryotic-like serine/threonine-protein kinase